MNGLKDVGKSSTFWTWVISIVLQVLLPVLGVPIPGAETTLSATLAGGPVLYGVKEGLKNFGKGESK